LFLCWLLSPLFFPLTVCARAYIPQRRSNSCWKHCRPRGARGRRNDRQWLRTGKKRLRLWLWYTYSFLCVVCICFHFFSVWGSLGSCLVCLLSFASLSLSLLCIRTFYLHYLITSSLLLRHRSGRRTSRLGAHSATSSCSPTNNSSPHSTRTTAQWWTSWAKICASSSIAQRN